MGAFVAGAAGTVAGVAGRTAAGAAGWGVTDGEAVPVIAAGAADAGTGGCDATPAPGGGEDGVDGPDDPAAGVERGDGVATGRAGAINGFDPFCAATAGLPTFAPSLICTRRGTGVVGAFGTTITLLAWPSVTSA